eukprot:CAMPEP_0178919486 /NCGR_PEP_ID=MMETSP0786-20121207/14463_1 /TAXON_ID=186022 /ORGANISM="Thalassionema frauenfeldii, Strain CCMP 1798" /LENGTH=246 /DNA_ID=CAMNT_0020593421 /DNA_START=59 /DNA_END=799 /DNA_ORIENTATION=+
MKKSRPKLLSSNVILLMIISLIIPSDCFTSKSSNIKKNQDRRRAEVNAVKIEGYDEAFEVIDQCAMSGEPSDNLYDAVRFVDKNAIKIYPDLKHKQELWNKAHGSWKLQLATGGGKFKDFKAVPIFAFAMIDEENFGNGIGLNEKLIILSLLGPHEFKDKWRQMVISIDDLFLFGSDVTGFVPSFVGNGIGLRKRSSDFKENGQRPPAFTFIGASGDSLIARGGSGGIAIWTRLKDDIRPAAYGTD